MRVPYLRMGDILGSRPLSGLEGGCFRPRKEAGGRLQRKALNFFSLPMWPQEDLLPEEMAGVTFVFFPINNQSFVNWHTQFNPFLSLRFFFFWLLIDSITSFIRDILVLILGNAVRPVNCSPCPSLQGGPESQGGNAGQGTWNHSPPSPVLESALLLQCQLPLHWTTAASLNCWMWC